MSASALGSHARATVGIDLVDVARARRVWRQPGGPERLLTEGERAYCSAHPEAGEHVAARFAAKEAVLKAFGTGLSAGMRWTDVEVVRDARGRPGIRLHGEVARCASRLGLVGLEISLAHTEELAIAQAVALWTPHDEGGRDGP